METHPLQLHKIFVIKISKKRLSLYSKNFLNKGKTFATFSNEFKFTKGWQSSAKIWNAFSSAKQF
jgi:hypothetical protein